MSPSAGFGGGLDQMPDNMQGSGAPLGNTTMGTATSGGLGGLDAMFSRLSHSVTANRPTAAPPGIMARNSSGRSYHNGQGPLSPLSGPVLTGDVIDDDDIFGMET